jgi:hypothetical protein
MQKYTLNKFLADLAILGLSLTVIASTIFLALIFVLLNAITHR